MLGFHSHGRLRFEGTPMHMFQRGLFDGDVLPEEAFDELLRPIYPRLWQMIRSPFDDLLRRRAEDHAFQILSEGEAAVWLRPQIMEHALNLFDGDDEIQIKSHHGQKYLCYQEKVAIVPKKIRNSWKGKHLTFSSFSTPQNVRYWEQAALEGVPSIPRLIVGYQFVDELTDIKILVGLPKGKRFEWCYLMPDQSLSRLELPTVAANSEDSEDRGFSVRPIVGDRSVGNGTSIQSGNADSGA